MRGYEREEWIISQLDQDNFVSLADLVSKLSVSEATARRDLQNLEAQGKIKRVPGGAIKPLSGGILTRSSEIHMHSRLQVHPEAKRKAAQLASSIVQDGECIFLDGGSSIVPMIQYLKNRPIKIITHNNLLIAQLDDSIKAEIITIGGIYSREYAMSLGTAAVQQVSQFNYDRCFISCVACSIPDNMTYTVETETRDVKLAAMHNSRHCSLLIDDSKEDLKAFCHFEPLNAFESVFSNAPKDGTVYPDNFHFAE